MNLGDKPVAIIIANCRTPELVKQLIAHIEKFTRYPYVGVLINNPADISWDGQYTINVSRSIEYTGALLMALTFVDTLEQLEGISFYAYWTVGTSIEFLSATDYLTPMVGTLNGDPSAVMVSPEIEGTAWDSLHPQGHNRVVSVWGVDENVLLWRAEWFNSIGRYDPRLLYSWGTVLEACWKARRNGKKIYVHHGLPTKKHDGIAERMGRRLMGRDERNSAASANMHQVLGARYGHDFLEKLGWEYRK